MAKKRRINIQELDALDKNYGTGLSNKKTMTICLVPTIFAGVATFGVMFNIYLAVVFAIAGFIWGYYSLMPLIIQFNYEESSFKERNKAITILSQLLMDKNKTISKAFSTAKSRLTGEIRSDIYFLETKVGSGDREAVHEAFATVHEKYADDAILRQFLEQMETFRDEGNINGRTLKDLSNYHTDVLEEQVDFMKQKNLILQTMIAVTVLLGALIAMATNFSTFEDYLTKFAQTPIGYIFGISFLLINFWAWIGFTKHFYDYSVTTIDM